MVSMNRLDNNRRAQVIAALVESNSIRSTVRMTGVAKNTIVKLLAEVGEACANFQDGALRGLPCKRVQADEAGPSATRRRSGMRPHLHRRSGEPSFQPRAAYDGRTQAHLQAVEESFGAAIEGNSSLRVTPAMEAGVTDHVWTIDEIIGLLD